MEAFRKKWEIQGQKSILTKMPVCAQGESPIFDPDNGWAVPGGNSIGRICGSDKTGQ